MRNYGNRRNTPARIRMQPDERRRLIVEVAFNTLAEQGFEGLRTRDIAATAKINSATLHHYFETKEDLIEAIADHLEHRLRTERAPGPSQGESDRIDPFSRQFEDLVFYYSKAPEVLAVYREFVARAPRDRVIAALVARLHARWKAGIAGGLEQARTLGVLRPDIDIDSAAGLVLCTAWGLLAQIFASPDELESAATQLRLLMQPPALPASSRRRRT